MPYCYAPHDATAKHAHTAPHPPFVFSFSQHHTPQRVDKPLARAGSQSPGSHSWLWWTGGGGARGRERADVGGGWGPSQHPGSTLWRRLVARLALVLAPHHVVEANKQHGQTQNDATRQSVQECACVLALVHTREQQHVPATVTTEAVSPSPTTAHGHTSPQPTRDNKSSSVSRAQQAAHEAWLKQRGSTTPGVTTRKKNGVRFFHARSRHTGHHCLQARSRALATPTPRFRH